MCLALHITPDKPNGWEYSVFIFLCKYTIRAHASSVFVIDFSSLPSAPGVSPDSSRQSGIAAVDIWQLPVDVYRGQDDPPGHGNVDPAPIGQRVCDGLEDESLSSHRRRVLGTDYRAGTMVSGRIHRASSGKKH